MKVPFHKRLIRTTLLLAMTILLWSLLHGCGSTPKTSPTRVDPATVSLGDKYHDAGPAHVKDTTIDITPPPPVLSAVAVAGYPSVGASPTPPAAAPLAPAAVNVDNKAVTAPPGYGIHVVTHESDTGPTTDLQRNASAAGPTLRTDGDGKGFDGKAPEVSLAKVDVGSGRALGGGGNAVGGVMDFSWNTVVASISTASTGQKWCWTIGILLILAAVGMVVFEHFVGGTADWPLVGILAGSGLAFIALGIVVEQHPMMLVFVVMAGLAAVAWYVWYWKFKTTTTATTTATATTTTTTPAAAPGIVSTVEADIAAIKARLFPPAPPAPAPAPPAPPTVTL